MKYRYLVFDVDGTLLDFGRAYAGAQRTVAAFLGIDSVSEFIRTDKDLSWELWSKYGLDDVENPHVQQHYHSLYESYLKDHFTRLADSFGVKADAAEVVDVYYAALSSSGDTMEEETLETYQSLSQHYKIIIATNGLRQVQRSRLADFLPMTAGVYISEDLGSIKPSRHFFNRIIDDFGGSPCEYMMIGDSISTDIRGAKRAGMSACWYDAKRKGCLSESGADFSISKLCELKQIL